MGRRYLWVQLNDDLHQLTSAQMLGKIFLWSVLRHNAENLITRGAPIAQWQRQRNQSVSECEGLDLGYKASAEGKGL